MTSWRTPPSAHRERVLRQSDAQAAERYHAMLGGEDPAEHAAVLRDLSEVFAFRPGMKVLDAGAGTGAVCRILSGVDGLHVTALEPAPAMLALLQRDPAVQGVEPVLGFCDGKGDREHFAEGTFDVVVCRQLCNELYDPLTAFANWRTWLVEGGAVVVMEGQYGRDAWAGPREAEADELPLSACQTRGTIPYLLEAAGLQVEAVGPMRATNALPATRTPRYLVVARKAS